MPDLGAYLRRPIATVAAIATDPIESWMWLREHYAARREADTPANLYEANADWEARLQSLISLSSPRELLPEFWALWTAVMHELQAQGIRPGPESFKSWNDGDAGFVRAIWCLVRHLHPANVVETGVAHGVTSRFILEALAKNGDGHLWSIDRPPMESSWRAQIGIAVNDGLRARWSYIAGSSRRRLPKLLERLGHIDLFVHDSLHTERNVRFELDLAWTFLSPGGAIVVDDIDVNRGFHCFARSSGAHSLVCEAEPVRPDLRRFNAKGMFGIALK
jgi:hypothetical protein